jgi:hypothetical protein
MHIFYDDTSIICFYSDICIFCCYNDICIFCCYNDLYAYFCSKSVIWSSKPFYLFSVTRCNDPFSSGRVIENGICIFRSRPSVASSRLQEVRTPSCQCCKLQIVCAREHNLIKGRIHLVAAGNMLSVAHFAYTRPDAWLMGSIIL